MMEGVAMEAWRMRAIMSLFQYSQMKSGPVLLSSNTRIICNPSDFMRPEELLNRLHAQTCAMMAARRARIVAVLESTSEIEMFEKLKTLTAQTEDKWHEVNEPQSIAM